MEALYNLDYLYHSWHSVHSIYLAGATIIYCISASATVRSNVSLRTLASDLRLCSSLLSVGGEWWPMIRMGKTSFERLSSYTLQTLAKKPYTPPMQLPPAQPPLNAVHHGGSTYAPTNQVSISGSSIEDMLSSVLQSNGQLSDIFDYPLNGSFMDDLSGVTETAGFEETFPQQVDRNDFTTSSQQTRMNSRAFHDYLDDLDYGNGQEMPWEV